MYNINNRYWFIYLFQYCVKVVLYTLEISFIQISLNEGKGCIGLRDFPALGEQSEMVVKQENFNVRLLGGFRVFSFELVLIKVAVKVSQSISVWEMIQSNPYLASICQPHRIFSLLSNWPTDLSVQLIG